MSPLQHSLLRACLLAIAYGTPGLHRTWLWPYLVLLACLVTFPTLTVEIKDGVLSWWFGLGLIRKDVPIANISRGALVRVQWYHGWGIHLTARGWLYNVSGFKAVEFQTSDGSSFQLGSDEPEVLHAAVMTCIMK